ncbi:hypothetical protein [Treponema denticola]|uniref:hypothetical protein n=1 Tax=Treponema denticola TaxID=158 RepID=UPI0020A5CAD3|nr:hypothetical protein [Treponema denticola]UTC82684.1 hypothetical protein HGJ18_05490 [Treponema denticola]
MEKKWIVFYLTIIFVTCFGCLSRPETPKKNFVYNPNGREEFIFRSLEPNEKEKDYGLFALKRRNIDDYTDKITLPYKKYVGKRGFFFDKRTNKYIKYYS